MIGDNFLFAVREHRVLLLISRDDRLDALFEVGFVDDGSVVPDRTQRRLIYNIRKLRTGCAGCHSCYRVEVDIVRRLYLLCVDFQYRFTSRKVGQLNGHAPVETAGAGECGIERLRTVCRR